MRLGAVFDNLFEEAGTSPNPTASMAVSQVVYDDAQWIDDALRGDSVAFGLLVQKYQDRLFTALLQVTASRSDAEDIAQEAFVQAYVKLSSFAHGCSFYTWLYRIAFNAAISRRRSRRRSVSIEHSREFNGEEPADGAELPEDEVLRQERAGLVQLALTRLNEEHRAILVLREMEGCDYETISQILDLPVGTVRSRLHRARLQLKEHLDTFFDDKTF